MKTAIVVLVCFLYCCQAGVTRNAGVVIDGKNEQLPDVTVITTEETKKAETSHVNMPIGPDGTSTTVVPTKPTDPTTSKPTDPTTTKPTGPTTTKPTDPTTTKPTDPTTSKPTDHTTTKPTNPTTSTTKPTTSSVKPTEPTKKPVPSSTTAPATSTTPSPPSNRGFDGPSFIGGIVLASGLMAIGFVALKFYRARTELNYHTL